MFKVRVSGFLCVTLFLTYASTAAAQELSLFGVHLRDHKDNYPASNDMQDQQAVDYIIADVVVPKKNSMFDDYTITYNKMGKIEEIYAKATFGSFDLCKESANGIVLVLEEKFGRGFENWEGANGDFFQYSISKTLNNEYIAVVCDVYQGTDKTLSVYLRTYDLDDIYSATISNF
jgi:hypothetical protein